jgi:hypothetical protein
MINNVTKNSCENFNKEGALLSLSLLCCDWEKANTRILSFLKDYPEDRKYGALLEEIKPPMLARVAQIRELVADDLEKIPLVSKEERDVLFSRRREHRNDLWVFLIIMAVGLIVGFLG